MSVTARPDFERFFKSATGHGPFPWQQELFRRFANGTIERSVDIPTGLGKTGVMAIWLAARMHGAALPRRLVYVVDRRAVVDQATVIAGDLRHCVDCDPEFRRALGLGDRSLPISTLRGQHVDNREWLEDPASSAIVVGTVDMIGSRLLFEGYRTSRKMRPYHAGLLGADTLVVLDEAHLVPPFESLLETVADAEAVFDPRDEALRELIPSFKLMSLSATGRGVASTSFGLQDADLSHRVVRRRLDAPKGLTKLSLDRKTQLADALAEQAWKLAGNEDGNVRCIVYCDKREDATATKKAIETLAKGDKKLGVAAVEAETELFVGGRRVFERENAAKRLAGLGFMADRKVERRRPTFVISTSAGEVGVDLDADHMVCDLVAWERMVQRLGRVNRRGDGKARVIVVIEPNPESRARELAIEHLSQENGVADASPGSLRDLRSRAEADPELSAIIDSAITPAPLRPALSRALVDAWSTTSLKEHTGRPAVEPWLRGWVEDPPQTAVIWRTHLPASRRRGSSTETATTKEIEAFVEAAPPHLSELLEAETHRVIAWLTGRASSLRKASGNDSAPPPEAAENGQNAPLRSDDPVAVVLTKAGDLRAILRLEDIPPDRKDAQRMLEDSLAGATLIVDARIGGLEHGLMADTEDAVPRTVDDGDPWISPDAADADVSAGTDPPVVRFRVRTAEAGQPGPGDTQWRERLRFVTKISEDGEPSHWLVVEKWRHDAATEDDRSSGPPQLLHAHHERTEDRARDLACRLGLPKPYVDTLAIAARLHDEGKRTKRWQRAFNADADGVYAKTRGPLRNALLDGYRHELGSLGFVADDPLLCALPDDLQDLALHLIAAHHGFARPVIGTGGCEDAPPSAIDERASQVALRFARLQRRWGPWGLAWWEALLRAADHQASRDNESSDPTVADEH